MFFPKIEIENVHADVVSRHMCKFFCYDKVNTSVPRGKKKYFDFSLFDNKKPTIFEILVSEFIN